MNEKKPLFNGYYGRHRDLIRIILYLTIGAGSLGAGGYLTEDAANVSDSDLQQFKKAFITEMKLELETLKNAINSNQEAAVEKAENKFHSELREHVFDLHPK